MHIKDWRQRIVDWCFPSYILLVRTKLLKLPHQTPWLTMCRVAIVGIQKLHIEVHSNMANEVMRSDNIQHWKKVRSRKFTLCRTSGLVFFLWAELEFLLVAQVCSFKWLLECVVSIVCKCCSRILLNGYSSV